MIEAFKWFQLVTAFIAFRFVWCAPRSLATTEAFGFHRVVYLTAFWMRSHHFTHSKPGQGTISSPNPIVHLTSCLYVHYSFWFTSNRFNKQTFLPSLLASGVPSHLAGSKWGTGLSSRTLGSRMLAQEALVFLGGEYFSISYKRIRFIHIILQCSLLDGCPIVRFNDSEEFFEIVHEKQQHRQRYTWELESSRWQHTAEQEWKL